jgi:Protein of unknown function (DUF3043)
VAVFRRRTADTPDVLEQDPERQQRPDAAGTSGTAGQPGPARPGVTAGKGRPTPKRSEAESRRRQPYTAPTDRKAAYRQSRERDRGKRASRVAAMKRGEDWALPRKDQGPVRTLARDYVDSRLTASEFYLYGVILLVAVLFVPGLRQNLIVDYIILGILAVLLTEGWFVGRKVLALARQRYPGESTRGLRFYAAMRGTQMRRMRMPAPRVKRGAKI